MAQPVSAIQEKAGALIICPRTLSVRIPEELSEMSAK